MNNKHDYLCIKIMNIDNGCQQQQSGYGDERSLNRSEEDFCVESMIVHSVVDEICIVTSAKNASKILMANVPS